MKISIYLKNQFLYICAAKKTTDGVFLDDEPHLIVPLQSSCDEIGKSFSDALLASKEVIPHPKTFDNVPTLFFQHAKTKSWKAFVKGTRFFSIEIDKNGLSLKDYGLPDSRGGYTQKSKINLIVNINEVETCALMACEHIKEITK